MSFDRFVERLLIRQPLLRRLITRLVDGRSLEPVMDKQVVSLMAVNESFLESK